MNTRQLTASSRILVTSTGYNNTGFLGGLNSILNQLIYAEANGFVPVVYFDPWSNEFPDFNRQELFEENQWSKFFEPVGHYTYEEVLQFIESADHPLTRYSLHYLTQEEMLYLDFGNPKGIYSGNYGYYKHYQGDRGQWLIGQRKKAQTLIGRYIKVRPDIDSQADGNTEQALEKSSELGVVIDCFERLDAQNGLSPSLKPYFSFIDEYIKKSPECSLLLVTGNKNFEKKFLGRYSSRVKLVESGAEKDAHFNQWLAISKCDFLVKDHSEIGEFALYLNSKLPFRDFSDQYRPIYFKGLARETKLFRNRWKVTLKQEGISLKIIARLLLLANPFTQLVMKSLEKYRYSPNALLRWFVLFIDYVKLLRARAYFPMTRIRHRAFHAATHVNADFYDFENAPEKKYFEIRNAWDTNTGFFAYFMMTLTQLKFAETHRLKPVVNFNEPHNHYFEVGHSSNIWQNYFEPVAGLDTDQLSLLSGKKVTFLDHKYHDRPGNAADPPDTDVHKTKVWIEAHRAMKAALTKKYMKPKAFILEMVDGYYAAHMNDQPVLGVHIRGTDKDVDQKGKRYIDQEKLVRKIGPEEYFTYVDKYLLTHTQAKIFVATDQQQYLDSFIERYGERIITSTAMRTKGDEPLFRHIEGSKFQRGVEVMCDSLLLSRCDFLIKGWSNVSEAAICFNPSIPVIDMMLFPNIDQIDFKSSLPAVPTDLLRLHESLICCEDKNQSDTF